MVWWVFGAIFSGKSQVESDIFGHVRRLGRFPGEESAESGEPKRTFLPKLGPFVLHWDVVFGCCTRTGPGPEPGTMSN